MNLLKKITIALSIIIFVYTNKTSAASIYIEKSLDKVKVGDTFILNVYLDTDDASVNGVDGNINFNGNIDILDFNTAGSVLSLWPNKPSLNNNSIYFTGGNPSSFFGKRNKLFSFAARARDIGQVNFSFKDVDTYIDDGKGSKISIIGKANGFNIDKSSNEPINQLSDIIVNDKKKPTDIKIELGRDDSVYDGKYFISFYATDNESGINRYEVKENNLPIVRATHDYVLEDQSLKGFVEIKAIDNAGNFTNKIIELNKYKKDNNFSKIFIAIIILIIIFLLYMIYRFKIYTR